MADARPGRSARLTIGIAQLLLVVGAAALWTSARMPWVVIRSFDGLGPPKNVTLSGGTWSAALLPLALLLLTTAIAALAVRGWALRMLAGLLAVASLAIGYLGVGLWVLPDVAVRGTELAHVSLTTPVGSERRYWGAGIVVAAAVCTLVAAVLLMRSASDAAARRSTDKYAAPAARRANVKRDGAPGVMLEEPGSAGMSERMIWDALDEGHDPTDRLRGPDTEGR
ncbi:TIGR02234 family membrane protein [Mycobacterium tilburgii]|uniref:TIGR02234 family membrane protein n=1 Tax=Mycobacterium tilburgii TaxID=44467 RepID=UPI001182146F|nr:TIGR02234 family membrane protein [Mycobacterium tilburgii]